jgi:membrane protease YdiL (CAAX protease family)
MNSEATLHGNSGQNARNTALLGLILVSIAPSISVTTGFVFQAGILSVIVFVFTKIWIFGLPGFWHLKVENQAFSWSTAKKGGWGMSLLLGIGMMLVVWFAYFLLGEQMLQPDALKLILDPVGLTVPWKLAAAIVFWVFINSVLEEYVFRWFITTKSAELFGSNSIGIIFSAAMFTLHHAIALHLFGFIWWQTIIACFGLLSAAAIWSWLYLKYRSIWVCWLSHAICDIAVFGIGYTILF